VSDRTENTLEQRLAALRSLGAETFDGPGLRFIESLLAKAAEYDGAVEERLRARAEARFETFEATFDAARAEAASMLRALHDEGADAEATFAEAFARGDFALLASEGPRVLRQLRSGSTEVHQERVRRLVAQAEARGVLLPAELADAARRVVVGGLRAEPGAERRVREVGDRVARALYQEAAQHVRSAVVVARAHDRLSDTFGHYNPQALVARVLGQVERLSPTYLRAMLGSLEDLSTLRALPEPKRRVGKSR
jgi:hypothetical protein